MAPGAQVPGLGLRAPGARGDIISEGNPYSVLTVSRVSGAAVAPVVAGTWVVPGGRRLLLWGNPRCRHGPGDTGWGGDTGTLRGWRGTGMGSFSSILSQLEGTGGAPSAPLHFGGPVWVSGLLRGPVSPPVWGPVWVWGSLCSPSWFGDPMYVYPPTGWGFRVGPSAPLCVPSVGGSLGG